MIAIRPLNPDEVALLEAQHFQHSPKHRHRLARQQRGDVVYLVAWVDDIPVGHVLLKWDGTADSPMADALDDCPDIEDLFVLPAYRHQGVATRLMDAVESLARDNGYRQIGLGAGAEEGDIARQMYERRGYVDAGFDEYIESGTVLDHEGREHRWEEHCLYMIKLLSTSSTKAVTFFDTI